ncbi:peptidase dimerization domain-containing protein [Sphingomonas aurantiaca]
MGTTCVTTRISGGHALNALPQRATANINCRIFPGVKPATVMAELAKVAADPGVTFSDVTEGSNPTDASPLRADLTGAVKTAMGAIRPGVPVFPSMSAGASDLDVVPLGRRAELRRQPDIHQAIRRFQPRAKRTHADRQHPVGDHLLSLADDQPDEVAHTRLRPRTYLAIRRGRRKSRA